MLDLTIAAAYAVLCILIFNFRFTCSVLQWLAHVPHHAVGNVEVD